MVFTVIFERLSYERDKMKLPTVMLFRVIPGRLYFFIATMKFQNYKFSYFFLATLENSKISSNLNTRKHLFLMRRNTSFIFNAQKHVSCTLVIYIMFSAGERSELN